jgi:8-amino-7-oxononanoate synthase
MSHLDHILSEKLGSVHAKGSFRKLSYNPLLIDFCSNDYLGLARNEAVASLAHSILQEYKPVANGSGGSRLISGHHSFIDKLEATISTVHNAEAALVLNSGYNANMAVLSSIPQKNQIILYDELSHASIKDGMRLSFADRYSFKHNDCSDLENKLTRFADKVCYVVVESVYSMDGDIAPLLAISELCTKTGAILIVDEAHSTGVWGKGGSGLVCQLGLEKQIPIRIHTYGKAMGCHGASVVGSRLLKDYLINFARQFIYTTSLPLHSYACIMAAYDYLKNHDVYLQQVLIAKLKFLQDAFKANNKDIECVSQIVNIPCAGVENARQKAKSLQANGFELRAILSPTVAEGKERIRLCLHTYNTEFEISQMAKHL